jgi:DNA-binding XRE family transcriptional regulator
VPGAASPHNGLLPAPSQARSQTWNAYSSIEEYGGQLTCNHPRMASGKSRTPINVKFGKRLGSLRKEKGWTFTYMAEHSGLATGFLHALEHGEKEPCLNTLDILAKSFDLTISDLMRGV